MRALGTQVRRTRQADARASRLTSKAPAPLFERCERIELRGGNRKLAYRRGLRKRAKNSESHTGLGNEERGRLGRYGDMEIGTLGHREIGT